MTEIAVGQHWRMKAHRYIGRSLDDRPTVEVVAIDPSYQATTCRLVAGKGHIERRLLPSTLRGDWELVEVDPS